MECVRTFEENNCPFNSVSLSNDNNFLISGSNDKTLKLWNVQTGECIRTHFRHSVYVLAVSYSNE
jgi:WD40 repeat protein